MHKSSHLKRRHCDGFTMVEMIAVLVIVGILTAISGVFLAPMAQGFVSGRRMLRAANASEFALERLTQLLTTAEGDTLTLSAGNTAITMESQTGDESSNAITVAFDSGANTITLNGGALIEDVASYSVDVVDGVISNRVAFQFADEWPIDLLVYPRN